MRETKGELFNQVCGAMCITTNGFVTKAGKAVMGRGCAAQAAQAWPMLPQQLGKLITREGNKVFGIRITSAVPMKLLVIYPVKPTSATCLPDKSNVVRHMQNKFKAGDTVPGWACIADLDIIKRSAHELVELVNLGGLDDVCLPRPGCGAGELSWKTVGPVLHDILDDRFIAVTY